jgi:alanine dehydrogenase
VLFTYLHLAPAPELTRALLDSGATCIAYETVETDDHRLPLLAPMSEVAGRLAPQAGAAALERPHGGRGILLGGVAGVPPAKVVVLGGGIVGYNAAHIAVGMQADVWILDKSVDRMRELDPMLDGRATIAMSSTLQVEEAIAEADLVIGAVLVPGARAPKLVTREMLGHMRPGAVLVDVAIDQGGCFETSHATTHSDPTYVVDGIVHYCVANMPGAVPITSTKALTNATLPYVEEIADRGFAEAVRRDRTLARGVSVVDGKLTSEPVAEALGHPYAPLDEVMPLAAA